MKKILIFLIIPLLFISCNSSIDGEGMGNIEQEFATDVFSNLKINCNCDVTIIPSTVSKVVVESHQNLIDNLQIKSKKKDLEITESKNVDSYELYNVNVYVNEGISKIDLEKNANAKFSGTVRAEKLKLTVKDKSHLSEAHVQDIRNLELDMDKDAKVVLTGSAVNVKINSSGKSDANLSGLTAVDVDFKTKDYSSISLHVLKGMSGTASDNSQVLYTGDPKKDATEKDKARIQLK